jgi:hypothetical protein
MREYIAYGLILGSLLALFVGLRIASRHHRRDRHSVHFHITHDEQDKEQP